MDLKEYEFTSEFVKKNIAVGRQEGLTEGRVLGRVETLLTLLKTRGLVVSDTVNQRLLSCHDLETLDRWIARALTAASAEEVVA